MDRADYLYGGLREHCCASCGVSVQVRKNSLQHTSVQWHAAARQGCPELGLPPALSCAKLRESIAAAVRDGRLEIHND